MANDMVTDIMAYESGQMRDKDMVKFFAKLIKSGDAWRLQGSYGRTAKALIDDGFISNKGVINRKKLKAVV